MKKCIPKEDATAIIETHKPRGTFYFIDGDVYVGIDNRSWNVLTKKFTNLENCLSWLNEDAVILDTFPDNDDNCCKMFRVSKSWLIALLERLDDMNNREGVNFENFLENYVWDETYFIYIKSKEQGMLLEEYEFNESGEKLCDLLYQITFG